MPAREFYAEARTSEARDRLAVLALGGVRFAQQRADAGFDPQYPVGARYACAFRQPLKRGPDERLIAGSGCRLGQLGDDEQAVSDMVAVLKRHPRSIAGRRVASDAVAEHRLGVSRDVDHPAKPAGARSLRHALDQLGRNRLLAT